jgi:hypothetical protein
MSVHPAGEVCSLNSLPASGCTGGKYPGLRLVIAALEPPPGLVAIGLAQIAGPRHARCLALDER